MTRFSRRSSSLGAAFPRGFQRETRKKSRDRKSRKEIADYFLADYTTLLKLKAPTWTRHDLQEAIEAVVTQKMRFTQASTKYGIPKGTLYDNILGKSKRMMILEEAGLDTGEETAVLEFCCDISVSPYNRRTKKSLNAILNFVEQLRQKRDPGFVFAGLSGFRWWWAFCKKHSIVSLYFNDENENGADSS
ncbi:protein bric-a-brac 1-like protein [Lasius niger]|uniref:Protein bric-a-brac 1-like protein n=1 Tax=Lasius niger TaxID=67767 RepID=A0A0J7KZN0_LASNI|nr:protein bric-a-brac 1-like protein [Lasius niger]